jgi:hypothetical protein
MNSGRAGVSPAPVIRTGWKTCAVTYSDCQKSFFIKGGFKGILFSWLSRRLHFSPEPDNIFNIFNGHRLSNPFKGLQPAGIIKLCFLSTLAQTGRQL